MSSFSGPGGGKNSKRSFGAPPPRYRNGRAGSLQYNKDQQQFHEYHGNGTLREDGGIDFNDETPDGKHSHTIRDKNFNVRRHRPEDSK